MTSNEQIIKDFVSGKEKGHNGNGSLKYEHNVLYSYGTHFPMLLKFKDGFILNKSKYSPTTSRHQNICRNAVDSYEEFTTNTIRYIILNEICLGKDLNKMSINEVKKALMLRELED